MDALFTYQKKKKNFMDALQTLFIDLFVPVEFKSHHIGSFFIFSMMLLRQMVFGPDGVSSACILGVEVELTGSIRGDCMSYVFFY